ncbi:MAG: ribosome biogenesis GTPase Der [Methylococcales bacterium]|nr:ribosome biogenesis GTPase Der [Methylococcales bacterium]
MNNLPVIALVGRPNVGKSTLFNYLTRSREALVADYPGLTRDRQYGRCKRSRDLDYLIVDTGGLVSDADGIQANANRQVQQALNEADVIVFMVDARAGITSDDEHIGGQLRRLGKPLILTVNKSEGLEAHRAKADFHSLGLGDPQAISATHSRGITELLRSIEDLLPDDTPLLDNALDDDSIRVAVIGRPNVGKSTLVNRILGEERVVVFDHPGTTRDSIDIPFNRDGQDYTLIDTAGIRRRARIDEKIEKFSVIKALQAIERAHVVIYLIDAREGMTDQDAHLLGQVLKAGRALIVGLNKWDGMTEEQKQVIRRTLDLKLTFLDFAHKIPISALHGSGVGTLFDRVGKLYQAAMADFKTPQLTQLLNEALASHQPPLVKGRRIKLKYAHQGGKNPPLIIIHGTQTDALPEAYRRFLNNYFRQRLKLHGTPLRLEFKSPDNPFKDRKNPLNEQQIKKRQRLRRHSQKTH